MDPKSGRGAVTLFDVDLVTLQRELKRLNNSGKFGTGKASGLCTGRAEGGTWILS
jgi:hypothetical protein